MSKPSLTSAQTIGGGASHLGVFWPRLTTGLAGFAGFATFFPIGLSYLALILIMLCMLVQKHMWSERFQGLRADRWLWVVCFFCVWPLVTLLTNHWFDGADSRLFHIFRVALILCIGLMMLPDERRAALVGLVLGAWVAALIIAVHRIHPLPAWEIWSNLLLDHAHRASQKHIAMATVCGICVALALRPRMPQALRATLLGLAAAMVVVVLWHASSRNAHILILVLPAAALVYRFRSVKAWATAAVLVTLLAVTAWQFSGQIRTRTQQATEALTQIINGQVANDSVGLRYQQWKTAYDGMVKQPIEGTGLASWLSERAASVPVGTPGRENIILINNPHNDYLLFGMETGIPGMLSVLVLMAWFLWRSLQLKEAGGDLAFILTLSVGVTAMINAPLRDATLGMALMWLMAAASASQRRGVPRS